MRRFSTYLIKASAIVIVAVFLPAVTAAQDAKKDAPREKVDFPETEIFLFELNEGENVSISGGENVTSRKGYDNQPSFTPDSQSFLYSRSDDYQTDVYEYNIAERTHQQITRTTRNEFSPMATPDNKRISFVNDGPNAAQNIAVMMRSAPSNADLLLPSNGLREPVGYYSWNHESGDVLYWSRYGFNVSLAHEDKKTARYVSGDAVPSTPHIIPGSRHFSFVHRQGDEAVWIKSLDPETHAIRPLVSLPGSNANYVWSPAGAIFLIEKDVLYRWKENETEGWENVASLSEFKIKNAARLSISPDGKKLAIVGQVAE